MLRPQVPACFAFTIVQKTNKTDLTFGIALLEETRLPVTRWVKLSLNFELLVPK